MLVLFSIIYGPLVVYLTDSFSDTISAASVLGISSVLIVIHVFKKSPAWIIPLIYFFISLGTLIFGETVWLKFGPLAISLGTALLFSMRDKMAVMIINSMKNRYFQEYMNQERIKPMAPIWISAAWINVVLHIGFLAFASKWLWAFYVSVGWYAVFACAAAWHIYLQRKNYE
ncbi:MAG: hypothetical protein LBF13_00130 [Campylobacteraceae bacterium]|jgi:hypothetical protein|nr:hypothetical protein [Campylobacteraceae bacterium]